VCVWAKKAYVTLLFGLTTLQRMKKKREIAPFFMSVASLKRLRLPRYWEAICESSLITPVSTWRTQDALAWVIEFILLYSIHQLVIFSAELGSVQEIIERYSQ
jgi:hypothetical protein